MTVSTLTAAALEHQRLLPALDAATDAARQAHEAACAHTDAVLACRHLPADVYQYAPGLPHAAYALTAAGRALTTAADHARAHRTPDTLHALHRATVELTEATAALRYQTSALATAAAWYSTPVALPTAPSRYPEFQP